VYKKRGVIVWYNEIVRKMKYGPQKWEIGGIGYDRYENE